MSFGFGVAIAFALALCAVWAIETRFRFIESTVLPRVRSRSEAAAVLGLGPEINVGEQVADAQWIAVLQKYPFWPSASRNIVWIELHHPTATLLSKRLGRPTVVGIVNLTGINFPGRTRVRFTFQTLPDERHFSIVGYSSTRYPSSQR